MLDQALPLPCGATLPNRIMKAAMTEGLADANDAPDARLCTLYERWSEGGSGLLLTGNVMIDGRYLERPGNVVVEDDSQMDALRAWASGGRRAGNHFFVQLSHPGRQCPRLVNGKPLSASDVQLKMLSNFAKPRPLTHAEIDDVVQRFVRSALLVREAGFSGVQIHAAHGYLLSQFLSPVTNRRSDEYGGSLENRARLLLRVIRAVRAAVGEEFPIAVKQNSADFQRGGFSLEDSCRVAGWLSDENIDLLEISGGTYEQLRLIGQTGREGDAEEPALDRLPRREAYFIDYALAIRERVKIPLAVTGGFRSRAFMEQVIANGEAEVIGLARPLCVDPAAPRALLNRTVDDLPAHENALRLGSGWLGPASPLHAVRVLNSQASVAWYYRHIIALADGGEPDLSLGTGTALRRHLAGDYRKGFARLRRRRKLRPAAA